MPQKDKLDDTLLFNQWVHIYARLFGYWSFHIDFKQIKSTNSFQMKISDWFSAAMAIVVYLVCIYLQFVSFYFLSTLYYSLIEMILFQIAKANGAFISILTVIMDLMHRNKLWKILQTFYYFGKEVI